MMAVQAFARYCMLVLALLLMPVLATGSLMEGAGPHCTEANCCLLAHCHCDCCGCAGFYHRHEADHEHNADHRHHHHHHGVFELLGDAGETLPHAAAPAVAVLCVPLSLTPRQTGAEELPPYAPEARPRGPGGGFVPLRC